MAGKFEIAPEPELLPRVARPFPEAAFDVVAVAASAGGIGAIGELLADLPKSFPASIVIVQHLDPRHRSLMADILRRRTRLQVQQAREGDRMAPGTVYIAPPDRHLLVNPDGTLSLTESELVHFVRPSADLLFESVAASYKDRAIAVVLTGTGSDGSMGVGAIKKMGGTVIAQDEKSAEFTGMPLAALHTGNVDFVLPLEEIPSALVTLVMKGMVEVNDEARDPEFERLLQYLLETRGFDFSGYKRTSLQRRVNKRMSQVGVKDYTTYLDYLKKHDDEFAALFNTILINVTSYFRDPDAWKYLQSEILPRLISSKERYEPIRVWCAGAASGEEAYTVAMQLCETLGTSEYRDRAKIYATDVDEEALTQARIGRADARQLEELPQELRDKYFEQVGTRYMFRTDLRRSIIFGRHDLVHDAPISRIDLLICRNALMYFDADAQGKILARLHYALNDKGFLFLGKAEMLLSRDSLFLPVDLKHRVFTKVAKASLRERLGVLAQAGNLAETASQSTRQGRLREVVTDALPMAQLVIDMGGYVVAANARARSQFGLVSSDVGRPLQDLEISYRPLELRSRLEQTYRERRPVTVRDVERAIGDGEPQYFDVEAVPLLDSDGAMLGASITFTDVTAYNRLTRELERSKHELETASEELQATDEELETTNEELQSTVEELETTNEELQSSNEELETMNEELESTNSELQTINTELQQRSIQLDHVNTFLQQIMSNLQVGVAVLDKDLRIQLWNRRAEDLWVLRAEEAIGQALLGLDIGLPMEEIGKTISDGLLAKDGHLDVIVPATNRRGRKFSCRIQASPIAEVNGDRGVIVLMEPQETA